jgi:arylsulfatase A-like enzyme
LKNGKVLVRLCLRNLEEMLSEMLQTRGYNTYLIGKYHLLPSEFESPAGPFDRWPLGARVRAVLQVPGR